MGQGDHTVSRHVTALFSMFSVARICVIIIIASMISALFVILYLDSKLSNGYSQAIGRISSADYSLFTTVVYSSLFQIFVALSAMAVAVIFYSHKVVGPIYRFTLVFRDIAEGKLKCKTRIRKHDQLQSIASMINFMKCGLRGFLGEVLNRAHNIEEIVDTLELVDESEKGAIKEKLIDEIESLEDLVARIRLDE